MPLHLCQQVALTSILRTRDDLVRTAKAVPTAKLDWVPGGISRHTLAIVGHCAASNFFFASIFSGAPLPYRTEIEQTEAISACDTLDKAELFLNRSVTTVCDAIVALPESRLEEQLMMPWGERISVALSLFIPNEHMRYHEGQINYIQTLLGDDEYH